MTGIASLILTIGGIVAILVWLVGQPDTSTPNAVQPPVETHTVTVTEPAPPTVETTVVAAPAVVEPPASSLNADDKFFLELLDDDGIPPDNPRRAIAAATGVCWSINHGKTLGRAVLDTQENSRMTYDDAVAFTADAVAAYCPHAVTTAG